MWEKGDHCCSSTIDQILLLISEQTMKKASIIIDFTNDTVGAFGQKLIDIYHLRSLQYTSQYKTHIMRFVIVL